MNFAPKSPKRVSTRSERAATELGKMDSDASACVGFIGLGLLGQAMALRLAAQGVALVVWNREPERCVPLAAAGAVRVDPDATRVIAARAAEARIEWVDAPVSGGPAAAADAALTVMVGGKPGVVSRVDALLRKVASRVTHVGEVGSGQAMKVVNQALVGASFVLLAEALALARGLGLPADRVPASLAGGLADSLALQRVWPRMVEQDFEPPTGRAAQMLKDLRSVERVWRSAGLVLPLLATATAQYAAHVAGGAGDDETVSISRLYAQSH